VHAALFATIEHVAPRQHAPVEIGQMPVEHVVFEPR
jgi:hypothetical protein